MPHCAPPEAHNADAAGCAHCGRMMSRKWLCTASEPRTWFCAGEKAKHGCRNKARAANAAVWVQSERRGSASSTSSTPSTTCDLSDSSATTTTSAAPAAPAVPAVPTNSAAPTARTSPSISSTPVDLAATAFPASPASTDFSVSTAVVPTRGSHAEQPLGSPHVAALPALIMSAWQTNDALLMSQALASAHRSGFTLSGALSLALAGQLRSAEEVRQAKFDSLLSPELRAALCEDGEPCVATLMRDGKHYWAGNRATEREFGLTDGVNDTSKEVCDMFTSFVHPEDALVGVKAYEDTVHRLYAEQSYRVTCVSAGPERLLAANAMRYHGYLVLLYIQLLGPDDEHACVCKFTKMSHAESAALWTDAALSTLEALPLLLVDEPPPGPPVNIHPVRPRLVPRIKRSRADDETSSTVTSPFESDASSSTDVSIAASPRSPVHASIAASPRSPVREEEEPSMVWQMKELIDLVGA